MSTDLDTHRDLFGFFHDRIHVAREDDHVDLTDDATLYLAQLLTERARLDRQRPDGDTLAELHLRHAHASPSRQVAAYRELGDRALHELACFHARVRRTVVGPAYYEDMGAAAYARLDSLLKRWFSDAFGNVFMELAERFRDAASLLRAVRHGCEDAASLDRLLAHWEDTRSEHVRRLLMRRGLLVAPGGSEA